MARVMNTSGFHRPSKKGIGGKTTGSVGTGSPGAFARTVTGDKDMSMSRRAESGTSPKWKSTTNEG